METVLSARKSPLKNSNFSNNRIIKNENNYGKLTKKVLDLQLQLAEIDVEFNELKESNEFLTNERVILEESLIEAEEKIQTLNKKLEDKDILIDKLKNESNLNKSNFLKNSDNDNFKNELYNIKKDVEILNKQIDNQNCLINNLKLKIEEKDQFIKQLKKKIDEYDYKIVKTETEYKLKISKIELESSIKEENNKLLLTKYLKHRRIWQENEKKANFEIKKLDEVIDNVINTLKNKMNFVQNIPEIKILFDQLTNKQ